MAPLTVVEPRSIIDQLDGATIAAIDVSDEEGMHFYLADGRVLIIAGVFAISLMLPDNEKLH